MSDFDFDFDFDAMVKKCDIYIKKKHEPPYKLTLQLAISFGSFPIVVLQCVLLVFFKLM